MIPALDVVFGDDWSKSHQVDKNWSGRDFIGSLLVIGVLSMPLCPCTQISAIAQEAKSPDLFAGMAAKLLLL